MGKYSTKLNNDSDVVYVYINHFEWFNKNDEKLLEGHPKPGRLYRAVKQTGLSVPPSAENFSKSEDEELLKEMTVYHLRLDEISDDIKYNHGILGITVRGTYDKCAGFEATVTELSDDNILDLDITEEDYRKLDSWVKNNNTDFMQDILNLKSKHEEIDGHIIPVKINEDIKKAVKEITEGKSEEIAGKIKQISCLDPIMLGGISSYLSHLVNVSEAFDPKIIRLSDEISIHEDLGKGANMYDAISALDNYMHSKFGNEIEDLYFAVDAILREIVRVKHHKRDNG